MDIKRFPVVPWPLFWLGKPIWLGSKCKLFLSNPNFSNNSSSQFCAFGETQIAVSVQSWGCWKVLGSFFCLTSACEWFFGQVGLFTWVNVCLVIRECFWNGIKFWDADIPTQKGHRNSPACCSERWILHFPRDGISNHFSCNKTI